MLPPIGILGGTFDPIHNGHLRAALEVQQAFMLVEVRLIPCFQPPHRPLPIATPDQRLEMVRIAIENEPLLKVDDCEIKRQGISYMVETLEYLRSEFPENPLCLILGVDAFLSFSKWHRYQDILKLAHLIVAHRPSYELPSRRFQTNKEVVHKSLAGEIFEYSTTPLEISSTEIRKQFEKGENPHNLLPDGVNKYIKQHRIYPLSQI